MPFIAIAAVIMIALGGGVTVAADQAKQGDALYSYKVNVNDNVRHEYHALRASLSGSAHAEDSTTVQVGGDSHSTATTTGDSHVDSNLRVRSDASAEIKAADQKYNDDSVLKANIGATLNLHN